MGRWAKVENNGATSPSPHPPHVVHYTIVALDMLPSWSVALVGIIANCEGCIVDLTPQSLALTTQTPTLE